MTTPHKDAEKLRAIADGKQMQVYGNNGTPWVDATSDHALFAVYNGEPCRIKPDFIVVNGVECPKHSERLRKNWVSIGVVCSNGRESTYCFESVADAIAVYEALIKPFKECQE